MKSFRFLCVLLILIYSCIPILMKFCAFDLQNKRKVI
ncbi:hypothetical protein X975_07736, partial [Stegodyphus mimosarum]